MNPADEDAGRQTDEPAGNGAPTSARHGLRGAALACALLFGLLGDALLDVPGRPGLNAALCAIAGTLVLWILSRRRPAPVAMESRWLVAGALCFTTLLTLRDAEALAAFCLISTMAILGLAAGRGALAWARSTQFVELMAAAVRVGLLMALGPLGWSIGDAREEDRPRGDRPNQRHVRTFVRGTLMALPALFVLTALLASADPMFERLVRTLIFTEIDQLLEHLMFIAVIAWFTSGYLRAFLVQDEEVMDRVRLPRPSLAPAEIAVALSLLNILFLVFLVVQVRYLFGGAGLVEVTEGLSYAEYARRGFFELVAATALVVPLLLIADWAASDDAARARRALRAASALLVVLLAGVLASAAYRMRLYQEAYGLTEQRLYVSAFMIWLTGVLGWLALTVLRGRRRGFVFGAIMGGLALVAALHVLNPHALIARINIERAVSGAEYDGHYLLSLSADAVPALIERMELLPEAERCRVATMLRERWSGERPGGWRTWNLGDARARRLVEQLPPIAPCAPAAEAAHPVGQPDDDGDGAVQDDCAPHRFVLPVQLHESPHEVVM